MSQIHETETERKPLNSKLETDPKIKSIDIPKLNSDEI